MACINKNLPGYQELKSYFGESLANSLVRSNGMKIPTVEEATEMVKGNKVLQFKKALHYLRSTTSSSVDDLLNVMPKILQKKGADIFILKGSRLSETPTVGAKLHIQDAHIKFLEKINDAFGPIFKIEKALERVQIGDGKNEPLVAGQSLPTRFIKGKETELNEESLKSARESGKSITSPYITNAIYFAEGKVKGPESMPNNLFLPYSNKPLATKLNSLKKRFKVTSNKVERAAIYQQILTISDQVYSEFKDAVKQNLESIYNAWDPELIKRSKHWYEGANRLANRFAKTYGFPIEATSGIMAALSPQNEWFNNISGANRVLNVMQNYAAQPISSEMFEDALQKAGQEPFGRVVSLLRTSYEGRTLNDVMKDIESLPEDSDDARAKQDIVANLLRVIDLAVHSRDVSTVSPEGTVLGTKMAGSSPARFAWGSSNEIFKAISIYQNPSIENISKRLGKGNKVRNFYNNIVNPNSTNGETTIDTHALGAALLNVVSANEAGSLGLFRNDINGNSPLYVALKEAYQDLAKNKGLLPRELQSITWEAVRLLIHESDKTEENRNFINNIWKQVQQKKLTRDDAIKTIIGKFQFYRPEWIGSGNEAGNTEGVQGTESTVQQGERNADNIRGQQSEPGQNITRLAADFPEPGKNGIVNKSLPIQISPDVTSAINELKANGSKALIIGGAVRDALLGMSPKDVDIEVYNTNYRDLEQLLSKYGKTNVVGKSFGIVKFTDKQGNEYDFSLPRRESKIGIGHKGFDVQVDENMTPKEAAERRDFTWNALAYDPATSEIHDYYGGIKDLKNNVVRHTSEKFKEDPLRILRAMQFQGRFGMQIDPATQGLMKTMVENGDLKELPVERLTEEWMKWATKSKQPSLLFDFIRETGIINMLPHIAALKGVEQDSRWHPEGDVEIHTKHVVDAAAEIADREGLKGDDRAVLMFAALTHDFAKPLTTAKTVINGEERITARGHEKAGGPLAKEFLENIGIKKSIIDRVVPLVENHLEHVNIASAPEEKGKIKATKKLAVRLKDSNINELLYLVEADASGRPPLAKGLPESGQELKRIAQENKINERPEESIIKGRHLMDLGMEPGPKFKTILTAAKAAQENGEFTTEEAGKQWLNNYLAQGIFGETNPESKALAEKYKEQKGITTPSGEPITTLNPEFGKKIADAYIAMKNEPENPEVKASYKAFADETLDQYKVLTDAGYKFEIYTGEGEPYATADDMVRDVRDKKHMYILSTNKYYGPNPITAQQRKENPFLQDSGFKDIKGTPLLINDVFRGVHDLFGHTERGNGFGPIGEENAWDVHARMYTPLARRAMTVETRGHTSMIEFGPHARDAEGNLTRKITAQDTPLETPQYPVAKIGLLPEEFSQLPVEKLAQNKTGATQQFFTNVVTGAQEQFKPQAEWKAVLPFTDREQMFKDIYDQYEGNFDMHIATSIPTFRETQIKVGAALSDMYSKGGLIYDIGGSEGGFVKAITQESDGAIKSINLDVNEAMKASHEKVPVPGSEFVNEAFLEPYTEEGKTYPRHIPSVKADVVHESMVFQFISPERAQFIKEIKDNYIKPNGIVLLEEKVLPSNEGQWLANEKLKDSYKLQYYPQAAITAKADQVLVGMKQNQTAEADLVNTLEKNFTYVAPYWDSGNFKGYIATDSKAKMDQFFEKLGGPITSEYSSGVDSEENTSRVAPGTYKVSIDESELATVAEQNKANPTEVPFEDNMPDEQFQKKSGLDGMGRDAQAKRYVVENIARFLNKKFNIQFSYENNMSIPWAAKFSNGKIVINLARVGLDTPFHEIAHPFVEMLKSQNPELYNNLIEELKNSEAGKAEMERVAKEYPELGPQDQLDEALVSMIGKEAAKNGVNTKISLFTRFWNWVKEKLFGMGIDAANFHPNTSIEGIANMITNPMFTIDLSKVTDLINKDEYYQKKSTTQMQRDFDDMINDTITKLKADVGIPGKTDTENKRKFFSKKQLDDLIANRKDINALNSFVTSGLFNLKDINERFDEFIKKYESTNNKSKEDIRKLSLLLNEIEDNIAVYGKTGELLESIFNMFPDEKDNFSDWAYSLKREKRLMNDYHSWGLNVVSDWLFPYYKKAIRKAMASNNRQAVVSDEIYNNEVKLAAEEGITDKNLILERAVKQEIKNTLLIAKHDASGITGYLAGVLNSRDSIASTVGQAVMDELHKALKFGHEVDQKFKKLMKQYRGSSVFSSNADEKNFYAKYLRQAKVWTYLGLDENGNDKHEYRTHAAFHEEYEWDTFYNKKREDFDAILKPFGGKIPTKTDLVNFNKYKAARDAWFRQNTVTIQQNGKDVVVPANQYKNAQFAALQGDQLFKEMYSVYKSSNLKLGGQGLKYGIVPQSKTSAVQTKGIKGSNVLEALRNWVGEQEQVYFTQSIAGGEKLDVPISFVKLLEEKDLSYNLINSVAKFAASSSKYESMKMIEPQVHILKNFIGGNNTLNIKKRRTIKRSVSGLKSMSKIIHEEMYVDSTKLNTQLNSFLNDAVYGQSMKKDVVQMWDAKFDVWKSNDKSNNGGPVVTTLHGFENVIQHTNLHNLDYSGFEYGKERKVGEYTIKMTKKDWNFSVKKTADRLGLMTALSTMIINPISSTVNLLRGKIDTLVEATGGRYLGLKDFAFGEKEYYKALGSGDFFEDLKGGKPSFLSSMLIDYDAIQGELQDGFGKKIDRGLANKLFRSRRLFFLQNGGEHYIQTHLMIGMMNHQKVTLKGGGTISLYEARKQDFEGKIKLFQDTNWTEENDREFRETLAEVNSRLNGNYNKTDKAMNQRTWWGAALMMFRKHIYNGLANRYRKGYVNYQTGDYTEGYWRTFWNGTLREMGEMIRDRQIHKFDLNDQEKYAFKKFGADVAVLALLVMAFKMFDDDDDDNEVNDSFALIFRRLVSESGQYAPIMLPFQASQIVQNPSAVSYTVNNFYQALKQTLSDPTEEYERTGPGYKEGENKAWKKWKRAAPGLRIVLNTQEPERMLKFYQQNSLGFLKPSAGREGTDENSPAEETPPQQ